MEVRRRLSEGERWRIERVARKAIEIKCKTSFVNQQLFKFQCLHNIFCLPISRVHQLHFFNISNQKVLVSRSGISFPFISFISFLASYPSSFRPIPKRISTSPLRHTLCRGISGIMKALTKYCNCFTSF